MGQNARYTAFYAKQLDARIEEFVMREELIMLTAQRVAGIHPVCQGSSQRQPWTR